MDLDPVEVRILGCLIEKQRTTPDQYPLSLNALRLACNQSTNRDPVVHYDEETIRGGLHRLGRRRYTRLASGHSSRASKYRHLLDDPLHLHPAARAADAGGAQAAHGADAGLREHWRARGGAHAPDRQAVRTRARAPPGPEGG